MSLFLYFIYFNVAWLGVNGWGPFKTLLYSDYITCDHNKTLDLNVSEVQVYFYDFKNNFNISLKASDAAEGITAHYNLDVTRRLVFFVPGYKSHISKSNEELMRQTFKDVPNSYLIIIDHSEYTNKRGGKVKSYERSVLYTYYVGKALGKLLAEIHNKGYPAEKIHCIGHSLGSQMLGYAGTEFTSRTSEKLWRITGIDPAGPCFSNGFIQDQIRSGVAEYVEVYHCNAGGLGTTSVLADADFFLNKGISQPDCSAGIIPTKGESDSAKCSHKACVRFWTETVHRPGWYSAWKCDSFKDFKNGRCYNNEMAVAGYTNPGNASGVFYASTESYGIN